MFFTATVIITVLDVNDNHPEFSVTNQVLNVSEATQIGTEITTFTATDADKDQLVMFTLKQSSHFNISTTGKHIFLLIYLNEKKVLYFPFL